MQLHADWAVTMGCGDACPYVPTTVESWDVPDPAGLSLEQVRPIRDEIEARVRELIDTKLEAIRSDSTAHEFRLAHLLPVAGRRVRDDAHARRDPRMRRRRPLALRRCRRSAGTSRCWRIARRVSAYAKRPATRWWPTSSVDTRRASSPTSTATSRRSQAALARIDELGIETVYCGGDLVGYGPHPNEVCALIAEREIPTIYGNYDYAIARDLDDCGCAYITPEDRELGQRSVDVDARAHRPGVEGLHARAAVRPALPGRRATDVHLVHGSPRKVNEYLFEDKPARLYERLAAAETDEVLVFGHTHKPWVHEYGGVLFVNCGSVGKPKDGDPRGAFAILRADATRRRRHDRARRVRRRGRRARGGRLGLPTEYADKLLAAA